MSHEDQFNEDEDEFFGSTTYLNINYDVLEKTSNFTDELNILNEIDNISDIYKEDDKNFNLLSSSEVLKLGLLDHTKHSVMISDFSTNMLLKIFKL